MLGCITAENAVGWALDPCLAFNTLPAADELNHFIMRLCFGVCFLWGFTLDEECTGQMCAM